MVSLLTGDASASCCSCGFCGVTTASLLTIGDAVAACASTVSLLSTGGLAVSAAGLTCSEPPSADSPSVLMSSLAKLPSSNAFTIPSGKTFAANQRTHDHVPFHHALAFSRIMSLIAANGLLGAGGAAASPSFSSFIPKKLNIFPKIGTANARVFSAFSGSVASHFMPLIKGPMTGMLVIFSNTQSFNPLIQFPIVLPAFPTTDPASLSPSNPPNISIPGTI